MRRLICWLDGMRELDLHGKYIAYNLTGDCTLCKQPFCKIRFLEMFIYVFPIVFDMEKSAKRVKYSLPEPPSPSMGIKRETIWLIIVIALMIVTLIGSVDYDKVSGNLVYRDSWYGYGGGSGFGGFGVGTRFSDVYSQYGYIIDTALFLLLFLGIGKGVLKKHFGEGGTSVYVGLGLFLAFALLLWEENTGFYLLQELGPLALILLILIIVVLAYRSLKNSDIGLWWIPIISFGYLLYYYGFYKRNTSYLSSSLMETIWYIAVGAFVISLLVLVSRKGNKGTTLVVKDR